MSYQVLHQAQSAFDASGNQGCYSRISLLINVCIPLQQYVHHSLIAEFRCTDQSGVAILQKEAEDIISEKESDNNRWRMKAYIVLKVNLSLHLQQVVDHYMVASRRGFDQGGLSFLVGLVDGCPALHQVTNHV